MIGREDEIRVQREAISFYQLAVLIALAFIFLRLFYLQVLKGEELKKFSEANRLKKERKFSTRGILYDRTGKIIVDNRASYDIVLFSQYYPFTDEVNERLAKVLGMPLPELEKKIAKVSKSPSFYPILLKSDVSKDVIAAIEMDIHGIPGIDIESNVQRRYPHGELAAQILGYTGEVDTKDIKSDATKQLQLGDYIGKMGIERTYDAELRGANGAGYVEVDAMGRRRKAEGSEKLLGFVAQTDPVPGNNIYLTIDLDLQKVALQAMKNRKFSGSVVAVDPQNGEILAMINTPSYDPGTISGREVNSKIWSELRENKDRPLRNRAIQDHYPPGSTFKLLVAVAALSEKVVNLNTTFNCHGGINFGKRRFNCHRTHGVVDFYKAIRESCDVYFYNLGLQLGVDTIAKYARLFGLGSATGLKLGYEQKGLIPDSQWKLKFFKEPWQPGETLSVAIGQGYVATTPMQLVSAFASLGNGGFVYHPYLVKKIENRNGEAIKEFKPELMRKIEVSQEVFDAVKEGLSQVVNAPHGTATSIRSPKILISGKTGTAQVRQFADITKIKRCDALDYNHRHHGWFVGYAPKSNPIIAVVAIAEHGCHGASAAPIVKEVIEAYQEKLGLVGDEKILEEIKEERKKYPSIAVHKESVEDE